MAPPNASLSVVGVAIVSPNGTYLDTTAGNIPVAVNQVVLVRGTTSPGGSISDDPITTGSRAATTNPTAVTDGTVVYDMRDKMGRAVVVNEHVRALRVQNTITITNSTTETTLLAAGASGVFHDLTMLVLTNATATAVTVTLKDATAGTTRGIYDLAAIGAGNSSIILPFPTTLLQATAANNWTLTLSVNTVTVHAQVTAVKNI